MNRVNIADVGKHVGKSEVQICGWVHAKRSGGKIQFAMVRDGSGYIQGVVAKNAVSETIWNDFNVLTHESSIKVTGNVRADDRAPGGHELDVTGLEIVQLISGDDPFPITPKEHGIEFLMDHRHLWIRSTRQRAILKIRASIIKAVRDFLDRDGFTHCDTPILTPAACEGTSSLFEVGYFDEKVYLTQSGQLYLEALAMALSKVYSLGPVFRAEKSKTRRHLTEFWMVKPEMSYATVEDAMDLAEHMLISVVHRVLDCNIPELKILERDLSKLENITLPFPRISYDEAVQILKKNGSEIEWGGDLGGGDETILSQHFHKPVMVYNHPTVIKAFYMEPVPYRAGERIGPEVVRSFDVLAPEGYGEIIGGGQRMSSYELLVQRIKEHDLPREAFEWYLDLRKYGSVPHAGFGAGIERLVTWICGLEHVRESTAFPRMLYRLKP